MTISTTSRRARFLGNDSTTQFPFTFKVFAKADVSLTHIDATSSETLLTLDSHYSVTLNVDQDNNPGGTITYPLTGSPLATGDSLVALGDIDANQGTDLTNMGRFLPQVIENALDKLTILIQQTNERLDRTIAVSVADSGPLDPLPPADARANLYQTFDADGNPSVSSGTGADAGLRTDLAAAAGAALVGYDGGTVRDLLDNAKALQSYATLRAYTGRATGVRITSRYVAGFFYRDDADVVSADNGGTIIVDASGRRWKRLVEGPINVQWFGAVPDGADSGVAFSGTDNAAAFQVWLNYCSLNRLSGRIPDGKYRFAHQALSAAGYLTCTNSYYSIIGDSPNAELLIDEDPIYYDGTVAARNACFLFATDVTTTGNRNQFDRFEVKNLTLRGRWTHSNGKGGINGFRVEGFREVIFDGVHAYDIRNKITRCRSNNSFKVVNTHAERCARGFWRSQDTNKAIASTNYMKDGDDDALDFHSSDTYASTVPARTSILLTNNHLENCEGILALGAKHIVVSHNTLKLCHGTILAVGSGSDPEGNTAPFAVIVTNNTIIDPLERFDGGVMGTTNINQGAIYVSGAARSSASTSGVVPGSYNSGTASFLLPWDASGTTPAWGAMHAGDSFDEGSDTTVYSSPGGMGYNVTDNVVMRTLPDVAAYSSWGMGQYFHGDEGFVDPAISSANYKAHCFMLLGDMRDFNVSDNQGAGLPDSFIYFRGSTALDRKTAFRNGKVVNNTASNLKYFASKDGVGGVVAFADWDDWDINIDHNKIDLDPYHKATTRTAPLNGTWTNADPLSWVGIYMRHCKGLTIRDNDFKNCYRPVHGNGTEQEQFVLLRNIVRCNPTTSATWDASNVGVGVPERGGAAFLHIIEDGNPASATHGKVLNTCFTAAASVPTSGKYVAGHIVANTTPTTASSKTTTGWARQTTGSGHTVATTTTADWAPLVTTTS